MTLTRPAIAHDAAAIAEIYTEGIEDRIATFETSPRRAEDVTPWFSSGLPIYVLEEDGEVAAFAAAFPYSDRCCYGGIAGFSVYVRRQCRGRGLGKEVMKALIQACQKAGLNKLTSMVMAVNAPSLRMMASLGFREVGVHQRHGMLDDVWHDVVVIELLL